MGLLGQKEERLPEKCHQKSDEGELVPVSNDRLGGGRPKQRPSWFISGGVPFKNPQLSSQKQMPTATDQFQVKIHRHCGWNRRQAGLRPNPIELQVQPH